MNDQQLLRYSRHILLDELGVEGQQRLQNAHALVVGAGGLGCPASLYLCAAGIGRLSIADSDRVDLTNLQRQILYGTADIGSSKVLAARTQLGKLNPEVEVVPLALRLEGDALERSVAAADLVLDCSDNFATRHAINRACVRHAKPLVSGAAIRFDAQLAVFDRRAADSPCYACLFPESSDAEDVQCAVMGVLAPLTGMIGAMQALEAIKLIADAGTSMSGRLLLFDAKGAEWRTLRVKKDPACAVCGAAG
jgi:molybdopterin/thiamine biosynthesis adenylyltransferase